MPGFQLLSTDLNPIKTWRRINLFAEGHSPWANFCFFFPHHRLPSVTMRFTGGQKGTAWQCSKWLEFGFYQAKAQAGCSSMWCELQHGENQQAVKRMVEVASAMSFQNFNWPVICNTSSQRWWRTLYIEECHCENLIKTICTEDHLQHLRLLLKT